MTTSDTTLPAVTRILQQTQPWARFMGILGFVSVGFMLLAGVFAGTIGAATQNPQLAVMFLVYPVMAVVYIFPSMYLVRYSNRIRDFVSQGQPSQLEAALDAQRAFWKFVGILTLVSIAVAMCFFALALMLPFVMQR